jgi:hypothetical protein
MDLRGRHSAKPLKTKPRKEDSRRLKSSNDFPLEGKDAPKKPLLLYDYGYF